MINDDDASHAADVAVAGAAAALGFGPVDYDTLIERIDPGFVRIIRQLSEQLKVIQGTREHQEILERRRRGELDLRGAWAEICRLADRVDLETRTLRLPSH